MGAFNARECEKLRFSTNISLYLEMVQDRGTVTMEGE